ncbi:mucin-17 isoform X2 [Manduca sexta]|uniref:mucin-17 isoform X2 n=1 Tax=Manduca sexta TaxID=7130 RepID=UPI001181FA94|nr:mucin-17 isoform X2 [Manduca sexta]
MSNNLDGDRSVTTGKMYPIDLAPQKITIVKSVSNAEVKMALIPGQSKNSGTNQLIGHAGPGSGLMRPGLAQIISPSVASQGAQIVSQGSQIIGQSPQIISQSQLITPSGQIISPATQIISQGTQLSVPVSSSSNAVNCQTSVASSVSGTQVLNVAGQLVSGGSNLVVNSSMRTLPQTVRVLPPLQHHNNRPVQLSSVNVSNASGVLVSKSVGVGVTSHVPRGLAAGASLAVRPVAPPASQPVGAAQGGAWSNTARAPRGALVYGARGSLTRASPPASHVTHAPTTSPHSTILTLPTTSVLTSSGVISGTVRGVTPRTPTPTPAPITSTARPLPLLQRNYQPAKVVGVASVGVRGVVGNSAPTQLYYEVPRAPPPAPAPAPGPAPAPTAAPLALHTPHAPHVPHAPHAPHAPHPALTHALASHAHRPVASYAQLNIVNTSLPVQEIRPTPVSISSTPGLPRPSILRKRDVEGSPTKSPGVTFVRIGSTGWEDVPAGEGGSGSTTISASSSPAPDTEPDPPPLALDPDLSPRKKPRKQTLINEVRQCDYQPEDSPPSPQSVTIKTPKRPLLSSSYVCEWRSTALHFVRPADVRRREPRARDILAIAGQKHVLSSAEGWKVHHLTAQMDDLVSLESDVGSQLSALLRALDGAPPRALQALQPHEHAILELLKGNIQRSKIVCEGVQEAREDILRVFTHRKFVSDILTRQADKRCFRKHRSQS